MDFSSHIMCEAELFYAFLRPVPLDKTSLLLPMHWTSPCEANRKTTDELPSEASDYCMFGICSLCFFYVYVLLLKYISLIVINSDYSLFIKKLDRDDCRGPNSRHRSILPKMHNNNKSHLC